MRRSKNREQDDRLHVLASLDFGSNVFEITFRCKGYYSRVIHLGIIEKVKANDLLHISRIALKFTDYGYINGLIKGDMKKSGLTIADLFK